MNIVDFSEGILGLDRSLPDGRQAREIAAQCLRKVALNESEAMALTMNNAATTLESGKRLDITIIRQIGEERLYRIERIFLGNEKETSH